MIKNLLTLLIAAAAVLAAQAQTLTFPRMDLNAGIHRIDAEVAATQGTRMQGLMFRKALGEANGMLFVFTENARHCMWMRNTLIPLSVAFMDEKGRILNVEDMQPQTSARPCRRRGRAQGHRRRHADFRHRAGALPAVAFRPEKSGARQTASRAAADPPRDGQTGRWLPRR